ncbi:hypothetical protein Achl_4215 (plasmid) [Pseudarthrobacter chlorophenolicus A6]|uniref:Uncharacterized protein n=1 Tax=Pseudarthrobacter chlorophenolicus (strain ATCC 700700 / DSM 12829 / CIP 107037 / JCM 12360 / KCTC 9906 / NCIMB 13794 / A6) TaxID=452863 RepID=B8HIB9_PSECP|nr:hypothetical protein [Pseudarthrobacter chlorophenolicus]ACL42166.1 hypothetical protein Achl_4215 [Pseudarthrobacter chlorophenolicus A6]SDQ14305.1 hypothetical protein SAMN04489738_0273 [Pseudarthrobacter chlorophenolicus]
MTKDTSARQPKGIPVGGQFTATSHSEPDVSLTAPKVTSRGRTTSVTLPDGTVATRTSKSREYSHAIVLSPEVPELVIANREARIRSAQAAISAREEALKDPKFTKRRRFRDDRDPDVDHKGEPVYYGFEYNLMSADGKEILETMRGNSKGDTQGCYDPETLDYDVKQVGRVIPQLKLHTQEAMHRAKETITEAEADIKSVKEGTYNLGNYGVPAWSSRLDLAQKAANQYAGWTRRATVTAVDQ